MYNGKPIGVLTCNAGMARLFEAEKPASELVEKAGFDNPEARMHERDLTSDLPGRAFDSGGQGRHAMEQEVSPKQEAAIRFAGRLADELVKRRDRFGKVYLVASPAFLGLMREALAGRLNGVECVEIDKDYTQLDARALRGRLPRYL